VSVAVIAAGGRGNRIGTSLPKFEIELLGRPLVFYSLESFQAAGSVEEVVLVVPADRLGSWSLEALQERGFSKVRAVAAGGETRQESVRCGLELFDVKDANVLVHDAARPLVTAGMIEAAGEIPDWADGVICASPVTDTIKRIDKGRVAATLDRAKLVAVQTPQSFKLEVLKRAHREAFRTGFEGTDDSVLVERIGGRVAIIEGASWNIKITVPEDLRFAEWWISERGGV